MMKLVEQGKVDLDEPVTAYLPDFTMADPRYTQITVRMLLNHSSGLMGGTTNDAFLFGDQGNDDAPSRLLERLAGQTLQAEPGAYSVYSNDSFTLAQLVIERVSGMEYTAFLNQYLLEPLGLENTLTPMEEFDTSRLVKTYLGTDTRALPAENLTIVGTGGIYSTASDLAAFGGALCGEGLLSQASLDEMARTASRPWSRGATPSSIMPDWSSCPSMTWPPRCSLPAGSAPTISWPPPVSFWMPWLSRASRWRRRPPSPPPS